MILIINIMMMTLKWLIKKIMKVGVLILMMKIRMLNKMMTIQVGKFVVELIE